jgi:hypothetical protein
VFQSRRKITLTGDLEQPELVAEAVRTAQAQYWRSSSWWIRAFVSLWPNARLLSPVSYEILGSVLGYLLRLTLLIFVVAFAMYLLHLIPPLAKRFLQVNIVLVVPSASPLYFLLAATMLVNILIGASFVPVRRHEFFRECETTTVKGHGNVSLFFALMEEACTLLNPKGTPQKQPVRLLEGQGSNARGTFIESRPQAVRSLARLSAYGCLPLTFLLCTMGFTRLINFQRPVATVHYTDFLAYHLPDYVLEVALALGLVFAGLHIAEWARRLFGIQQFRSSAVLCHTVSELPAERSAMGDGPRGPGMIPRITWKVAQGADEEFVKWARGPDESHYFEVAVCWAELLTEAARAQDPRFVTNIDRSEALDEAMESILEMPFRANFQSVTDEPAAKPS